MAHPNLHPWPVVKSFLEELDSDDIRKIVGLSGLQVNWSLTKEESYSNKTKKRAFLGKIAEADQPLPSDDRRRMAFVVAGELENAALPTN